MPGAITRNRSDKATLVYDQAPTVGDLDTDTQALRDNEGVPAGATLAVLVVRDAQGQVHAIVGVQALTAVVEWDATP